MINPRMIGRRRRASRRNGTKVSLVKISKWWAVERERWQAERDVSGSILEARHGDSVPEGDAPPAGDRRGSKDLEILTRLITGQGGEL